MLTLAAVALDFFCFKRGLLTDNIIENVESACQYSSQCYYGFIKIEMIPILLVFSRTVRI